MGQIGLSACTCIHCVQTSNTSSLPIHWSFLSVCLNSPQRADRSLTQIAPALTWTSACFSLSWWMNLRANTAGSSSRLRRF
ncbi:hypothetical protein TGAM01_v209253 [Trichoderma gamsii]|uniref:Uncharacterized protein n=1 Tax=Trichoderma gamsii TaxID=398673 RepID=A0A2P4ZC06_9HYPO|nr:hypothetical protein TGAM01_v209253 [Trichoderma gamsii]PON21823.1 hypothetical protein TGAM01_v209253 [Trichoderma gamsii]